MHGDPEKRSRQRGSHQRYVLGRRTDPAGPSHRTRPEMDTHPKARSPASSAMLTFLLEQISRKPHLVASQSHPPCSTMRTARAGVQMAKGGLEDPRER